LRENRRFTNRVLKEELQRRRGCLIKEGYLGNFNKDSCGIKILYGGAGRGYGGRGRIYPWTP